MLRLLLFASLALCSTIQKAPALFHDPPYRSIYCYPNEHKVLSAPLIQRLNDPRNDTVLSLDPSTCARAICIGGAAVWVCNDNKDAVIGITNKEIAASAERVAAECYEEFFGLVYTGGRVFTNPAKVRVVVAKDYMCLGSLPVEY
ncbi:uncharacterized protein DSM5745_05114 [Aspergillus mulundensis]|uniref:Ecp2 effector protein domain-containing protein n=1 Tax=Aspergillus mulundensis TaxID=1810919 RepID=A0A3D8S5H2_9EURO|nr:hypothetical protein DSM5745_05114 [Aspergillus mulundensis]RDW81557.1 hypothetical protein DSM5745_05114 [Aspergillus mulundensis]